MDKWKHVAL